MRAALAGYSFRLIGTTMTRQEDN